MGASEQEWGFLTFGNIGNFYKILRDLGIYFDPLAQTSARSLYYILSAESMTINNILVEIPNNMKSFAPYLRDIIDQHQEPFAKAVVLKDYVKNDFINKLIDLVMSKIDVWARDNNFEKGVDRAYVLRLRKSLRRVPFRIFFSLKVFFLIVAFKCG